jgi:hypothetical protein
MEETREPTRAALVLIEFQNEWLHPNGRINLLIQDREQFAAARSGAQALQGDPLVVSGHSSAAVREGGDRHHTGRVNTGRIPVNCRKPPEE